MLPEEAVHEIKSIIRKYPDRRSALLPSLYIAQSHLGHLPHHCLNTVASLLDLPEAHVRGVASFHVMFRHGPGGRHLVQLCTNVSCMSTVSPEILDALKKEFGLTFGVTTPDKRFTLIEGECIGECDKAPVMMVDSDVHTRLTPKSIVELLSRYT